MDHLAWQDMAEVATVNFLVPFAPWLWTTRAAVTAAAASTQPWWLVLVVANVAGLPSLTLMTWVIRHSHGWLARRWSRLTIPPIRHKPSLDLFLLSASPMPEYATALYAGARRCPWMIFLLATAAGRMLHHLPIVIGGVILGHYPWFRSALEWGRHPLVIVGTALIGLLWWLRHSRRENREQTVP